jgi:hypothetical protein
MRALSGDFTSSDGEAALHDLVQKIEGLALSVFLDMDGAFDNASFGSMDAASSEHGIVMTLRRWIDMVLL